jgi:undecaprenyl pyrophosphate phosphatase UppP
MSLPLNITGTIFLLGGAVLSVWRFARKKEFAYCMWANVLIAAGTICIAAAGSMARAGITAWLYPAEMVASAILLAGFLMAGTLDKGAHAAVERSRAERAVDAAPEKDLPGNA